MEWANAIQQLISEGYFGAVVLSHNGSSRDEDGLPILYAELFILDDETQTDIKPSEQVLIDALSRWQTAQLAVDAIENVKAGAKTQAGNIPAWAGWTEAQALAWIDANVNSLASAKVALRAMAQMLIALRNETWPDLQD